MGPSLRLDAAGDAEAAALLRRCCGSSRWIERMLARRPFGTRERLLGAARDEWFALAPDDWREAFGHHPMIGDRDAVRRRFPDTGQLSEQEQAGVTSAREDVLDALARGNVEYLDKFGYIFIVCAAGKRADEMLDLLRARLRHDPQAEIRVAAEEQARITELRLMATDRSADS